MVAVDPLRPWSEGPAVKRSLEKKLAIAAAVFLGLVLLVPVALLIYLFFFATWAFKG